MINKTLLFAMAFGFLSSAYAGEIICNGGGSQGNRTGWGGTSIFGKELGNGGNAEGMDFYNIAREVVDEVSQQPSLYPEISPGELSCALYTTTVILSEEPLYVEYNGVHQEVVAVNYNTPNRVIVHRSSWTALNENQKKSIALHELLGILGLESTGDYKISSRYFGPKQVSLYQCNAWLTPSNTNLTFSMSETTKGTWLDVSINQQLTERFYLRIVPGHIDPISTTPDSSVLIVARLKKGPTDWDTAQQMNFFGVPKLPIQFHLELDKDEPSHNDLTLDCKSTPN